VAILLATLAISIVLPAAALCVQQEPPEVVGELDGKSIYRYVVGGRVTEPKKLSTVSPVYPEAARRARIVGAVIVKVVISTEGEVADLEVLRGLPLGLTEAAVDAVRQWTFKPATLRGIRVPVSYILTVRFNLDDDGLPPDELVISGLISKDTALQTLLIHQVSEKLPDGCTIAQMRLKPTTVRVVGMAKEMNLVDELVAGLEEIECLYEIRIGERYATVEENKFVRFTVSARIKIEHN
jgi:protein TonB